MLFKKSKIALKSPKLLQKLRYTLIESAGFALSAAQKIKIIGSFLESCRPQ